MQVSIDEAGGILTLEAQGEAARFHAIWLYDNAPAHRDPENGQRLITLADIPGDVALAEAGCDDDQVIVRFRPDGEVAAFDAGWLWRNRYDHEPHAALLPEGIETWRSGTTLAAASYPILRDDTAARRDWLASVARQGAARIHGLPREPGALFKVIELFGHVRETNYGRLFDVRAKARAENLAYTGLGLQAHTDNPYRDPVPGLQLLACLENTVEGGDSSVVDGFASALRLCEESPEHFDTLTQHEVRFGYSGAAGVRLCAEAPVIELDRRGRLRMVRFNNRSLAPLALPFDAVRPFYDALGHFSAIVDDPGMAVRFRLRPGEAFLVDNTRVLHARTAFSGEGSRWLQGCYADRDGLYSTLAALSEELETAP